MINILFFAHLREEIGASIHYEIAQCTVQEVIQYVKQLYPQALLDQSMVAVNEEFAAHEQLVQAGDTVAFLPPVSGG